MQGNGVSCPTQLINELIALPAATNLVDRRADLVS
jgi:hypothetical protein